ncbi:MAG: ABC transporter permease [Thermoplasmata archaeon]|nr:ABC transporter permease [Thermoplasmata archaeon]
MSATDKMEFPVVTTSLPDSMTHVLTITKYELLNYFRNRRFYILLTIGLLISGLLVALVGYYRPPAILSDPLTFYTLWWGMGISFVVILSGIFFGGDAISGEFQNKTGYFLVGNPIRRSSIYVGKYLAALVAAFIIFFVYTFIAIANGIYYFGPTIPGQFVEAIALALLGVLAVLAFTFFFSALFKSSSMSILVSAILLLFGFTIISALVIGFASYEPWFLLTYGAGVVTDVMTVPYPAHRAVIPSRFGGAATLTFTPTIPEGIIIMFAYFVVCGVLGLYLFERKEFN